MKWNLISNNVTVPLRPLSALISHIGSNEFDVLLLEALNGITPIAEVAGYVLVDTLPPLAAGWAGERADIATRTRHYVSQDHKLDPVLQKLPVDASSGDVFFCYLKPGSMDSGDYRWRFFDEPEFKLEVTVALKTRLGWNLIKTWSHDDRLSTTTRRQLAEFIAFLFPIAQRHATRDETSVSEMSRPMAKQRMTDKLSARFPELSSREVQVCSQTLLGSTAAEIAKELLIAESSVKTYRSRAYKRLGVRSANELMVELI